MTVQRSSPRLVGLIFTAVGGAMLVVCAYTARRQLEILKSWLHVDATVTESKVTQYLSRDSRRNTSTTMFRTEVVFAYRVNGRDFVTPSGSDYSSSSYREMKKKADAFPPGTVHPIKYNPEDPNDIRHTAGYTLGFFFMPVLFGGMGVIFEGLGLVLLIRGGARMRRRAAPALW